MWYGQGILAVTVLPHFLIFFKVKHRNISMRFCFSKFIPQHISGRSFQGAAAADSDWEKIEEQVICKSRFQKSVIGLGSSQNTRFFKALAL